MTHLAAAPVAGAAPAVDTDEGLEDITSPIVGTFYASPSPDSKAFVSVGDHVDAESVICIIEAMKVMNEIKAEANGTVVKVLCKAGEAVEFGQALYRIQPD
jgi:acetyl-CoA carboxylase biotin carboxyl carrier protein